MRAVAFALTLWLVGLGAAFGHLMPTGHGTINAVDSKLYIILAMPAASFRLEGTRGGGLLNQSELDRNAASIREQLKAGLKVEGDGVRAAFERILLNLPVGDHHDALTNADLTVMIVAQLKAAPTSVRIESQLWADDTHALKIQMSVSEGRKTLRSEVATISAAHPTFVFFATPSDVAKVSFAQGVRHILEGIDHLLFVALMLMGSFVLRRWVVLMASFTLAYTLAFSVAINGWLLPAASWVEPVILGSLPVALLPLGLRYRPALRWEAAGVALLGVFHGFGFALAVGQSGTHNHLPWLKSASFCGGALLGQLLIAAGVAVLCLGIRAAKTRVATSASEQERQVSKSAQ